MGNNILTRELLLRSVAEWNKAREANPHYQPDLSNANLNSADLRNADLSGAHCIGSTFVGADLRGADISWSDLYGASFISANLSDAVLAEANLSEADLRAANMSGANISGANLDYANLRDANFSRTYLSGTSLNGADLRGTVLSDALLVGTRFGSVDLSNVIGLESVMHRGPSTIGIDTLFVSKGNIPEVFLRGCGVPDSFIVYARSLSATAINYYSCFISYSHRNEEFAQRLHNDLQASGVSCWIAALDLPIGAKTRPAIDEAIRFHDKLLLILSEHSVQSNWVEHEVEHALDLETERGKLVLFPVRLDDAVMDSKTGWASNVKRQRNIGDFTKWKEHDAYQAAFSRLLKDLKQ